MAVHGDDNTERWKILCAEAASEKDPARLLELIQEVNRLLAESRPSAQVLHTETEVRTTRLLQDSTH